MTIHVHAVFLYPPLSDLFHSLMARNFEDLPENYMEWEIVIIITVKLGKCFELFGDQQKHWYMM